VFQVTKMIIILVPGVLSKLLNFTAEDYTSIHLSFHFT